MGVCRICYCGVLNRYCLCASRASSRRGVQGPAQGPLVGSRGNAPARGPGGRAPESSWFFRVFKTPKSLSSHSFPFIFKTSFSAKSFDIVQYKMILTIRAHSGCSDRLLYWHTEAWILALTLRNDLLARTGVSGREVPP